MIGKATALIEKMVSNQGWNEEHSQPRTKGGMHTIKETDMLAAKLDLLLKKIDEGNQLQMSVPVHAMNSYYMCEVCGEGGHGWFHPWPPCCGRYPLLLLLLLLLLR